MTSKNAFDRQLAREIDHLAGPEPHVDVSEIVAEAAKPRMRPRLAWLNGSLRLATATAVMAVFGLALVLGWMGADDRNVMIEPGASPSPAPSPSSGLATPVPVTGTWSSPDPADCQPAEHEMEDPLLISVTSCPGLRLRASDPRLTGEGVVERLLWADDELAPQEEWDLANDDGTWAATRFHEHDRFVFVGDGAYAGMNAVLTLAEDGTLTGFMQTKEPREDPDE